MLWLSTNYFFVLTMSGNNPESEFYTCVKSIRDNFVYRAAKRRNPNFVCNHPMCRQMSLKTPKRKLNTSCENLYDPSSSMAGHSTDVPDSNGQLPRRWMPAVSSNVALAHPNDDDDQAICHWDCDQAMVHWNHVQHFVIITNSKNCCLNSNGHSFPLDFADV